MFLGNAKLLILEKFIPKRFSLFSAEVLISYIFECDSVWIFALSFLFLNNHRQINGSFRVLNESQHKQSKMEILLILWYTEQLEGLKTV